MSEMEDFVVKIVFTDLAKQEAQKQGVDLAKIAQKAADEIAEIKTFDPSEDSFNNFYHSFDFEGMELVIVGKGSEKVQIDLGEDRTFPMPENAPAFLLGIKHYVMRVPKSEQPEWEEGSLKKKFH